MLGHEEDSRQSQHVSMVLASSENREATGPQMILPSNREASRGHFTRRTVVVPAELIHTYQSLHIGI